MIDILIVLLVVGAILATLAEWHVWLLPLVGLFCYSIAGLSIIGIIAAVVAYKMMRRNHA